MKMQFSTLFYLVVHIIWIVIFLASTSLLSPRYPARAQTTDTNWALQFDGTTDNVLLAKTADIIGSDWTTTKSVNLWVKPTKPPGENDCDYTVPASCDTILGDKPRWWGITIGRLPWGEHEGEDRIWVWNSDDDLDFIGIPYALNEWVNIALVHEGGVLRAYKNGVLAGSVASGATHRVLDYSSDLYLGGTTTGPAAVRTFGGQIDEVHIWDWALSQDEIVDQMYQATITDTLGLKAYYQMSDGSGLTLTDDSQFNWNGILLDGGPNVNGDGDYAQWVEREAFVTPDPPAAPTHLYVNARGFHYVDQTWIDNSDNEFSFGIERCTGAGCSDFSLLDTILDSPGSGGEVSYTDTNVNTGITYCYRVHAANTGGESDYTNVECDTVPIPVFLPMLKL